MRIILENFIDGFFLHWRIQIRLEKRKRRGRVGRRKQRDYIPQALNEVDHFRIKNIIYNNILYMSKDLTNLYSPNCGQTLKFSMVDNLIKGRLRRLDKSNWSLTQLVIPVGLANCSTSNKLYMKIIKDFDLISKTNDEIFKEYVELLSPPTDTMNKGPDNVKLLTLSTTRKDLKLKDLLKNTKCNNIFEILQKLEPERKVWTLIWWY